MKKGPTRLPQFASPIAVILLFAVGCPGANPVAGPPETSPTPAPIPPTSTPTPIVVTATPTPIASPSTPTPVTPTPIALPPTGTPGVRPTPSPTAPIPPYADKTIAGAWYGTMAPKGCKGNFPASATFVQNGSSVAGKLTQDGCIETFGTLTFTGKYEKGRLSGTTTGDFPGGLNGELSGGTLTLDPYTSSGFHLGLMILRR